MDSDRSRSGAVEAGTGGGADSYSLLRIGETVGGTHHMGDAGAPRRVLDEQKHVRSFGGLAMLCCRA